MNKKIIFKEVLRTFIFVLPYIFVEFTNTLLVTIDKSISNSIGKTAIIVFSSFFYIKLGYKHYSILCIKCTYNCIS